MWEPDVTEDRKQCLPDTIDVHNSSRRLWQCTQDLPDGVQGTEEGETDMGFTLTVKLPATDNHWQRDNPVQYHWVPAILRRRPMPGSIDSEFKTSLDYERAYLKKTEINQSINQSIINQKIKKIFWKDITIVEPCFELFFLFFVRNTEDRKMILFFSSAGKVEIYISISSKNSPQQKQPCWD